MCRRRFLRSAALLAAGAAFGATGCSSETPGGIPAGEAKDNKYVSDSAEANNRAGGGAKKQPRRAR